MFWGLRLLSFFHRHFTFAAIPSSNLWMAAHMTQLTVLQNDSFVVCLSSGGHLNCHDGVVLVDC